MSLLLGALSWNPQVKGYLYVLIAITILVGSAYLLLMTNVGARLGFQLTVAGFFGWMTVLGGVWWVYGKGPVGPAPSWKPQATVVGDLATTGGPLLTGFPNSWNKLDPASPKVADALPSAEAKLVGPKLAFQSSSDYLVTGAFQKGGQRYGPVGLDFRPFNVFHKPRYLIVQVQKAVKPPAVPGQPPPKAAPDPSAQPVSVVMVRNLGKLRLRPALVCLFSALIFGIDCYMLHQRDKEVALARG